jgi:enoyl-[acyl-carrier protein] reductase II
LENKASREFLEKQRESIRRYDSGELTLQEAQLEIEHFWAGALRRAVCEGDIETGSLMAGQSVGMVRNEQPVREIFAELLEQAQTALEQKGACRTGT